MNSMKKKAEEAAAEPVKVPSNEEILLTESAIC